MGYYRSLNTHGTLQVAERWRDGVRVGFIAWWSSSPARVGMGVTRDEAIRNIPRKKAAS